MRDDSNSPHAAMSVFSRFRVQIRRTESENENRQILKRQRKECRKTLKVSLTKDPYTSLRFACSKNYVLLINHLLAYLDSMGVGVEEYGTERSPLRVVVISGNVEAAAALLDNRHISAFPTFPLALCECVTGTNMAMLRTLLFSSGGESRLLQARHSLGRVPPIMKAFEMAIEAKKYDYATVLIEALLQSGDSTYLNTCKANNGEPLVDEALRVLLTTHSGLPVDHAWQDLGKLLIQNGANVNAIIDGSSLLHAVSARGLYDKAVFLLDEDADVNLQSRSGDTPIFGLIVNLCKSLDDERHTRTPAKSEDHLLVRSLLSHGAKLDIQNEDGDTPLYPAVRSQNYTLLEILLNEAHDIASVNSCGETIFSIAAAKEDVQCMDMLIEKDITLPNNTGTGKRTPLMTAVEGRLDRTARWLLRSGALTDLIDSEGNTALHYAAAHKDTAIVDMLLNAGASSAIRNNTDWYPVHCAAKAGSFATYERIIKANASIVH
jgi:ankyrin repeat protein